MSFSRTHVLLPEDNVGLKAGTDSPVPRFFPSSQMDFPHATYVTFHITVVGATGSPTSWSLGAKFQLCAPATTGIFEAVPRYYDMQPEQVATMVVEGVGWYGGSHAKPTGGDWGLIADQTDTGPITVSRTVKLGAHQRIRVITNPQTAGGTSPAIQVGAVLQEK